MSDYFFITGLPRSRTSWLANLFTYRSSFCFHDLCKDHQTAKDMAAAMACVGRKRVGNSDSYLVHIADDLNQLLKPKWIIVQRNPEEALRSYMDHFTAHPYPQIGPPDFNSTVLEIGAMHKRIERLIKATPSTSRWVLGYEALNDEKIVEQLWRFIVPDEPFDHLRFKLLDCLLINPASHKVKITYGNKAMDSVLAA